MLRIIRWASLAAVWAIGSGCLLIEDYEDERCDNVRCSTYQKCKEGKCVCFNEGYTYCAGYSSSTTGCFDLLNDDDHCGSCYNSCSYYDSCSYGQCI